MSIDTLRKWLGTAAPSPHDTELRRNVRDALIEHDALAHEARHSVGVYKILKEFDVYGTGGDATSCAREAKQRVIDLISAINGLYGSIELDRAAWAEERKALEQQAAAAVTAESQAVKRADELEAVLLDAIRRDIIDTQRLGWSRHVYPLVAILDAAPAVRAPEPETKTEREYPDDKNVRDMRREREWEVLPSACGRCVECDGGRGYEFCAHPIGGIRKKVQP